MRGWWLKSNCMFVLLWPIDVDHVIIEWSRVIHALEILFKISRSAHKKAVVEARGQRPSRQNPEHHLRSLTRRSQHFSLRRDTPAHTFPIMTQSTSTLYSSSSPGDTERVLARLGHCRMLQMQCLRLILILLQFTSMWIRCLKNIMNSNISLLHKLLR